MTEMTEAFVSERIRLLRNERGISARELSLALGQNETYINKIETGQRALPMEAFFKICEFFGITPVKFFDGEIRNTLVADDKIITNFRRLGERDARLVMELIESLAE